MGDTSPSVVLAIPSGRVARGAVVAPPSKSHAIRALVCAALSGRSATDARPECSVVFGRGPLPDDVAAVVAALSELGFDVRASSSGTPVVIVRGAAGAVPRGTASIGVGGSATALRFLAAVCALGPGPYTIGGTPQLARRPAGAIVPALRSLGVSVKGACGGSDGVRPPLTVSAGPARGGRVTVDAATSSHVVSALLLAGPCLAGGIDVRPAGGVASRPYVDLTVAVMRTFGADVADGVDTAHGAGGWSVEPGRDGPAGYAAPDRIDVEGDWSSAAFLLAAAAATGGDVTVAGLSPRSAQADRRIVDVLVAMGAAAFDRNDGVRATGRVSIPLDIDLGDAPDLAPLVGALACVVPGTSRVRGAAHLRIKETDRIAAVARCARTLGCEARELADGFEITGPARHGGEVDPEGDHRIAMAFAVAGLAVPGTRVANPECAAKSYPSFWEDLSRLIGAADLGPIPGAA